MKPINQTLEELLKLLSPLEVDWRDEVAHNVIAKLQKFKLSPSGYTELDIAALLDDNFEEGTLICRLFLGQSKDQFTAALKDALGDGAVGVTRFRSERNIYLQALVDLGVLDAITSETNRKPHWSDVLVERLRSGRGSAISGQKRGRGLEDFAEEIITKVFGENFDKRCNFIGSRGQSAKCDFAIPSKNNPSIIVEAKGYGATGSKMTDVIGDIEKILQAKRHDTAFLLVTDGITWKQRQSDLKTIIKYQNNGEISRIYTSSMADRFEADLQLLKDEKGLQELTIAGSLF